MGHHYAWATREYILERMTYGQLLMYYKYIPAEGRVKRVKDLDKPDTKKIKTLMGGRKILER